MKNLIVIKLLIFNAIFWRALSMEAMSLTPTTSAHKEYPMFVHIGFLRCDDDEVIPVPQGPVGVNGWGQAGPLVVSDFTCSSKPIDITIVWFSLLENEFYAANISLAETPIETLSTSAYIDPISKAPHKFESIIIGLEPKGGVQLWLEGYNKTQSILYTQGDPIEIEWDEFIENPAITRERFLDIELSDLDQEMIPTLRETVKSNIWERNRKKTIWSLTVEGSDSFQGKAQLTNGEVFSFSNTDKEVFSKANALPIYLEIIWYKNDTKYWADVDLTTSNLYAIDHDTNGQLEFTLQPNQSDGNINITTLINNQEFKLSKVKIKR